MFKIVSISDTHNRHDKVTIPECDFLFHCGDWTSMGYKHEVEPFAKWLDKQPAKYIVIIPGNHELNFEKDFPESKKWITDHCPRANLLIDESITLEGVKIYGSPVTPFFCNWAYNKHRGDQIQCYWDAIPNDINILLTHGPPYGILDQTTYADGTIREDRLGCYQLQKRIKELENLDLHFFGHIHAQGSRQFHEDGVSYYNAAICDESYYPSNSITVVEYERE